MGPAGAGDADGDAARLSAEADALLTLRRLCKEYSALPSQVLAEDGGLLLQLLEVDGIIRTAEERRAQQIQGPMEVFDDDR